MINGRQTPTASNGIDALTCRHNPCTANHPARLWALRQEHIMPISHFASIACEMKFGKFTL